MRIVMLLLCIATLAACSSTRFGYNNADWLAGIYANRYLDLDRDQRAWFRERLRHHIEWHRRHELPLYVEALAEFRTRYQDGLEEADLDWALEIVQERYIVLAERLIPDLAELLHRMDERQIAHFEARVERDLAEDVERRSEVRGRIAKGEIEAVRKEYGEQVIRRIESWAGRMTPDQRARITALLGWMPPEEDDPGVDRRRARLEAFTAAQRGGAGPEELAAKLHAWWVQPAKQGPAEPQGRVLFITTFIAVDEVLTERQRGRIAGRLDGYRRDFAALAGR